MWLNVVCIFLCVSSRLILTLTKTSLSSLRQKEVGENKVTVIALQTGPVEVPGDSSPPPLTSSLLSFTLSVGEASSAPRREASGEGNVEHPLNLDSMDSSWGASSRRCYSWTLLRSCAPTGRSIRLTWWETGKFKSRKMLPAGKFNPERDKILKYYSWSSCLMRASWIHTTCKCLFLSSFCALAHPLPPSLCLVLVKVSPCYNSVFFGGGGLTLLLVHRSGSGFNTNNWLQLKKGWQNRISRTNG